MTRNDHGDKVTMHALREAALIRPAPDHRQSECLKGELLVAFADGQMSDSELLVFTPHLSSCRRCQHELASLIRALNDPEVVRAAKRDERARFRLPRILFPLAVAAAAIVVIVVRPERQPPGPDRQHRAPVLSPGAAPVVLSPVGAVSEAHDLRWTAVQGADSYVVTLFDADGRVLAEADAHETSMTLPDSLNLAPAQRYLWQVQARIGFNRWISSGLVEFRVISTQP